MAAGFDLRSAPRRRSEISAAACQRRGSDAHTHRGTSGAPIVMRASKGAAKQDALPWRLLMAHPAAFFLGGQVLH